MDIRDKTFARFYLKQREVFLKKYLEEIRYGCPKAALHYLFEYRMYTKALMYYLDD